MKTLSNSLLVTSSNSKIAFASIIGLALGTILGSLFIKPKNNKTKNMTSKLTKNVKPDTNYTKTDVSSKNIETDLVDYRKNIAKSTKSKVPNQDKPN